MTTPAQRNPISILKLAVTCLIIGVTGYGGPAILGQMKRVFVDRMEWINDEQFLTGLSLSQMLPGATGGNLIGFLGYQARGSWGAIIAPLCFFAPSLMLMTVLSAIYFRFGQVPLAKTIFLGLGAIVVALLFNATLTLGRSAIRDIRAIAVAVAAFLIVQLLHAPILEVVAISGLSGLLIYGRQYRGAASTHEPPPDRCGQQPPRIWWGWIVASAMLVLLLGLTARTEATRLFLSITRVGVLAFGGGFTSIPLFQREAVAVHPWLTTREFLDGIALGQITPGPVLVTATFIGYHVLGVRGALLGSIAIFAPGTLATFVMAHQHGRVKDLWWLQAAVKGIAASFIGVLLSVTVTLAIHSLVDWKTVSLAVAATIVLIAAKKDPVWVILGGTAASILLFR